MRSVSSHSKIRGTVLSVYRLLFQVSVGNVAISEQSSVLRIRYDTGKAMVNTKIDPKVDQVLMMLDTHETNGLLKVALVTEYSDCSSAYCSNLT